MGTKILVSNLPLDVDSSDLEDMFSLVGDVQKVTVEMDGLTGISRGVGYVEMSTEAQAMDCIDHFNGSTSKGHRLSVREDKPHVPKPPAEGKVVRHALFSKKGKLASKAGKRKAKGN